MNKIEDKVETFTTKRGMKVKGSANKDKFQI